MLKHNIKICHFWLITFYFICSNEDLKRFKRSTHIIDTLDIKYDKFSNSSMFPEQFSTSITTDGSNYRLRFQILAKDSSHPIASNKIYLIDPISNKPVEHKINENLEVNI